MNGIEKQKQNYFQIIIISLFVFMQCCKVSISLIVMTMFCSTTSYICIRYNLLHVYQIAINLGSFHFFHLMGVGEMTQVFLLHVFVLLKFLNSENDLTELLFPWPSSERLSWSQALNLSVLSSPPESNSFGQEMSWMLTQLSKLTIFFFFNFFQIKLKIASSVNILKLERFREDQHGPCARMTRKIMKRSTFLQ